MKQLLLFLLLACTVSANAQYANRSLNNLTAPTQVNQDLLPLSNTKNIGSPTLGWSRIFADSAYFLNGVPFIARKNNNVLLGQNAGKSNTTGKSNTAVGDSAMYGLTTGSANTVLGHRALYSTKTGSYNVAIAPFSLYHANGSSRNHAIGYEALYETTTGTDNIALGYKALARNVAGGNNTAIGNHALFSNTEGSGSVAVGDSALYSSTSGLYNTAIGGKALKQNNSGFSNVATGYQALYANTSGYYNTASGYIALSNNTIGAYNTANGARSLYANTAGTHNTAVGYAALYKNTTGSGNTAVGYAALSDNTTAGQNTALGYNSLTKNTTGYGNTAVGYAALSKNITGNNNTVSGYYALYFNITGHDNTAIGYGALYENTSGNLNTAVGNSALRYNTTGGFNAAFGYRAGSLNNNSYCSFFGYDADQGGNSGLNRTNSTGLGYNTRITGSNQVRIGNSSITSIGGYANWSNISDGRVKSNLKENVPGLKFINLLKPVTYNLKTDEISKFLDEDRQHLELLDSTEKEVKDEQDKALIQDGRKAKAMILFTGFVAQDVEAAANKIGYDFSGVDKPKNEKDYYGLRYAEFVVPLVKAVQELSKMNDEKDAKIDNLQAQIDELKRMYSSSRSPVTQQSAILSSSSLEQNLPNPFSNTTTINYTLPRTYTFAKLVITDKAGKRLKEISVSGSGKGSLQVDASIFSSGTYQYALYVNGKLVDVKQMLHTK